jgi:monofunctional glycosyltransferase
MTGKGEPGIGTRITRWVLAALLVFLLFSNAQVVALRFINPPLLPALSRFLTGTNAKTRRGQGEVWRKLKDISPEIRKAVLASEDQRFLWHRGFDVVEISHAVREIFRKGRKRGASTITMQVARTVFLWPARTWGRKIAETYYTFLLETFLSKQRILELYLNTVDWGVGVRGVDAASRKYFNTSSSKLSASQAALLAAILPSPHRWSVKRPNSYVRWRQQKILRDMTRMPLVGVP